MDVFGVRLLGISDDVGRQLLLSLALIGFVACAWWLLRALLHALQRRREDEGSGSFFWYRQAISIAAALVLGFGLVSIWFENPARLAAVAGLVAGGIAFALQKVVTSLAGYIVILRGRTFTVGDRISMGGVRGNVVSVGFTQTRIMEMGVPPESSDSKELWVKSRQFTGRIVTVSNSVLFDQPVYNYTRDFQFLWDELAVVVAPADRARVEAVLLAVVRRNTDRFLELSASVEASLHERFGLARTDMQPRVYARLRGPDVELTIRFIIGAAEDERSVKDRITRGVVDALEQERLALKPS